MRPQGAVLSVVDGRRFGRDQFVNGFGGGTLWFDAEAEVDLSRGACLNEVW